MGGARPHRGGRGADGGGAEPVPASHGARHRPLADEVPPRGANGNSRAARTAFDRRRTTNPEARTTMISSLNAVVPIACVAAAALAAMVAEAFREPGERMPIGPLGAIGLVGAAIASIVLWNHNTSSFGVVVADNFGLFVTWILILIGLLSLALSEPTIDREQLPRGEYYALMLFAVAGMMLMATASDLLVIFLALEILSLAVYVLTGIRRESATGAEAAFKYFLLGGFSSAFFLYGIAFTFGVTGSTRLDRVGSLM